MAQLSSPINSVSMAVHLLVLAIAGLARSVSWLFRIENRRYLGFATAAFITLIGLGAGAHYWRDTDDNEYAVHANSAYQQLAEQRLSGAASSGSDTVFSGWLTSFNEKQSVADFAAHAKQMNEVLPFWYQLNKKGAIAEMPGLTKKNEVLAIARTNNVSVIPTITNQFDPDRVSTILGDEDLQSASITQLVDLAVANNYAGWDIDWEQLYAGDQEAFTGYITNLSVALHAKHKTLSISVPVPSTPIRKTDQAGGFDYPKLGAVVDQMRVMAYDYHEGTSAPGPVTPLDEYTATIETIAKLVPSHKLIMALPTYGYDWSPKKAEGMQFDKISALLKEKGIKPKRDKASQTLRARYTSVDGVHEIWYEDADSVRALVKVAQSYGIDHFTLWRLGGEDPSLWTLPGSRK